MNMNLVEVEWCVEYVTKKTCGELDMRSLRVKFG
jgi:hypothetical protein